ncbi:hypothetical protein AeRB84_009172, partial [Aphanomyces euteiches]
MIFLCCKAKKRKETTVIVDNEDIKLRLAVNEIKNNQAQGQNDRVAH